MTFRPRNTSGDGNHFIPRDFLRDRCGGYEVAPREVRGRTMAYTAWYRGLRVLLVDTKNYGGIFPDWHIEVENGRAAWMECKVPEAFRKDDHTLKAGELKPGEAWLIEHAGLPVRIIETDEDFAGLLEELVS